MDRTEQFRMINSAIRNYRSGAIDADTAGARIQVAIDANPDGVSTDTFRAIIRTMSHITSDRRKAADDLDTMDWLTGNDLLSR